MRTQALRAAGILGSGPVGCPTLSLGLYFLSWPHCFLLGCWPWPRTSSGPGTGIHVQPTGFESRPPAKGFAGLEPKPQAPGVGLNLCEQNHRFPLRLLNIDDYPSSLKVVSWNGGGAVSHGGRGDKGLKGAQLLSRPGPRRHVWPCPSRPSILFPVPFC